MLNPTFQYSESRFNKVFTIDYQLTDHARVRCQQRGINKNLILAAITFGKQIYKQGFTYYYVTKKCLPSHRLQSMKRSISDLVVLVDEGSHTVVTCYWCHKGMIHLRKKCKSLLISRVA